MRAFDPFIFCWMFLNRERGKREKKKKKKTKMERKREREEEEKESCSTVAAAFACLSVCQGSPMLRCYCGGPRYILSSSFFHFLLFFSFAALGFSFKNPNEGVF